MRVRDSIVRAHDRDEHAQVRDAFARIALQGGDELVEVLTRELNALRVALKDAGE